ncbi:FEKKY domain-containing protein [Halpernia frigidisoli]|uniref:Uncharacterized protein n=1 Tax=Halpernia frigidisoli TaxID=1125876 RepID=A0A1I3GEJ9_9FLAO|nr:hypothetical protein [Halpernia frigidisoli]SFI21591.1 hypothetical protein SAMN05443292_1792 [Halpernia frigidisoli]
MKKYILLNIALIILIIFASTFGTYFSPLNQRFAYWWSITDFDWLAILLIISASIVFALLMSIIKIKNLNYKQKFLKTFCIFNVLILIFMLSLIIKNYINVRKELIKIEKEYVDKAKNDIKNDNVTFEFTGGLSIRYTKSPENKINNIYKTYGITYLSTGCLFDDYNSAGQQKYKEVVKPYLEKRNGKNWEQKMKSEVEKLKD